MRRRLKLARPGTPRPRAEREKVIEDAIDHRLGAVGFRAIRFSQARATNQTPGIPDRRYVHRELGLALWWEVKAPGGEWRPEQRDFAADCAAIGELYFVGGLDEMYELLRELGCWDGYAIRPQGWRQYEALAGRATALLKLGQLAMLTRDYWTLTPATRRKERWAQWLRRPRLLSE